MSLPADFDLKERVRSAIDIVDVVGSQLELRPQGRNFVARCPWHNDRRPSMTVNQERQTWKCWVCDVGGDLFSFVMRRDGVDFPTALRMLAEQAGIPIDDAKRGALAPPGSPEDKATLLSALKLVTDAYVQELAHGTSADCEIARAYLAERGISDESRQRFQIGFSPDRWDFALELLRAEKFSPEVAEAAGLAINKDSGRGHYDRFRGRLMFPIHDLQNRVIALGGRVIPAIAARRGNDTSAGAKYINGPETKLFRKSHQLYGLQLARDSIRRTGEVLVMEGYTDVVAARQAGVEPVVAVLGTALGDEHIRILKRFAQRVVLVLDGDAAGQRRADEVLELFIRADVDLRILTLPDGCDPAEYLEQHGREAFERLVAEAPDALDHKFNRLTDGIDVTRDTHRVTTAIDSLLELLVKSPRGDGLRVDQLLVRLSRTFGITSQRLQERFESLRRTKLQSDRAATRRFPSPRDAGRKEAGLGAADPNAMLAESEGSESDSRHVGQPSSFAHRFDDGQTSTPSQSFTDALPKLTGVDRELFETLIEAPALAGQAVEAIDPDWLDTVTAKMLLSAYQDLDLAGRELDVDSLLLAVENESLKNVVVSLQDRVQLREGKTTVTPAERYATILARYHQREWSIEKTRQIARLESTMLAEDEELALLRELFEAERSRQDAKTPSS